MKAPEFAKLFNGLPLLNQRQRQQVLAVLHPAAGLDRVIALIGEIRSKERCCPDCGCDVCRAGYPTTLAGIGRSMVGGSLPSNNCCVAHSRSSTDNDDSAFFCYRNDA
jgi:hypothetical protein